MPTLNWNEIRLRAARFSGEWAGATSERGDAQSFWDQSFEVFGVGRRRVAVFEQHVQKLATPGKNKTGRMDVFWPGMLLGEHKSTGEDLHAAYQQALGYLHGLKPEEHWLRPFLGAEEFINGATRWCLWLKDIQPNELRAPPNMATRVEAVKQHRLSSTRDATRKLAENPRLFGEDRQPNGDYIGVPKTSSERRSFIPVGFCDSNTIAGSELFTIPNATLYHFGILSSTMHNAWMRAVCGRLESRYRYSAGIVYNSFPWPSSHSPQPSPVKGEGVVVPLSPRGRGAGGEGVIEAAAKAVLDARAQHPQSTLADLYNPNTMPDDLRAAHKALDKAVDAAYLADGGQKKWADDSERVAFLFRRYEVLTSLLAGR